jgi:riboflavin synthase alpha subunit
MFTGIIEATASVLETGKNKLILERPATFTDIKLGASIAI